MSSSSSSSSMRSVSKNGENIFVKGFFLKIERVIVDDEENSDS